MPNAEEYRVKIVHFYKSGKDHADCEIKRVTLLRAVDQIGHYQAQYIAEDDNFTAFPEDDYRLFAKCYAHLAIAQRDHPIYRHSAEVKSNFKLAIEYTLNIPEPIDYDYRLLASAYDNLGWSMDYHDVDCCRNAINAIMLIPENSRVSEDWLWLAKFWNNLACAYNEADANHKAINSALKSLEFTDESYGQQRQLWSILKAYAEIGDRNNAMHYFFLLMQYIANKPNGILNDTLGRDWFGIISSLADLLKNLFYSSDLEYRLFSFIRKAFLGDELTFDVFGKLHHLLMTSHLANQASILFSILEQVMIIIRDSRQSNDAPQSIKVYFSDAENLSLFEEKLNALSNRNKEAKTLQAIAQSSSSFNIGVAIELTRLKEQSEYFRVELAKVKNELQSQRQENARVRQYMDGEARRSSLRSVSLFQEEKKLTSSRKRTGEEVSLKSRVSKH